MIENTKNCTDYDLMCKIKNGDSRSEMILFKRYEPYLFKKYKHMYSSLCDSKSIMDFEDFKQEAYFKFAEAVKYTDLSKITNSGNWKFLTPYMFFIRNLTRKLVTTDTKAAARLPTIDLYDPKDPDTDPINGLEETKYSTIEQQMMEDYTITMFKNSLSDKELNIVKVLENAKSCDSEIPINKVMNSSGYSAAWGYIFFGKIRTKYLTSLQF
jgi:hypothetical protein